MPRALEKAAIWLAATAVAANGHVLAQEVGEPLFAQDSAAVGSAPQPAFSIAQIEQLVAPIALYPDALLAQVLMAGTYPVEVVQADQWLKRNSGLEGEALDSAVAAQSWDPSVKTLVFFPEALERMARDLTWTQDLGDAFLAQEADVMAAVQRLRGQAKEAGNLESNSQQIVRTQGSTIVVEPADPTVVYVPRYNPTVVYGTTWVPATTYYPVTYSYSDYPAWVSFGVGVVAGVVLAAAIDWDDDHDHHHHRIWHRGPPYWGRGWVGPRFGAPAWHSYRPTYVRGGDVYVDRSRTVNIDKTVNIQNNVEARRWVHDPAHRRNVAYRDPAVARRFVGTDARPPPAQDGARPPGPGGTRALDHGAMRRLDRGQPAMLPSDRTTRDALQGDPRERRERIMRGQADAQRSGLAPTPGTPRQLQRPNDAGAGSAPPAGGKGRGPLSAGGPDGAAVSSPTPSATTEGPPEARPPGERTPPRGQRRATSGPPQGVEREQAPAASAPREAQRQWQRQPMPPSTEPQEAQPRVAPRQWQQRPDPRQMPPSAAPRDTQAPMQRQWQRQPMPPSTEPQDAQPRVAPRQWQQRPDARQMPPSAAPRDTQAPVQRQWQRQPMPPSAEPQEAQPRVAPRQWQQRPDARQMPPSAAPRDTPAPVQRQLQRQPMPPSAEPRQMAPQSASRSQSVQPRQRADGQGGQHRQRRRDEAAQPSP